MDSLPIPAVDVLMVDYVQQENLLNPTYSSRVVNHLFKAAELGCNSITMTCYGGDDTSINVLTLSESERQRWRDVFRLANSLGITPILYLSEWEHNGRINDATRIEITNRVIDILEPDLKATLCIGEEFDAGRGTAIAVSSAIRARRPDLMVALHNPWGGAPFSRFKAILSDTPGVVDIILGQATPSGMVQLSQEWTALGYRVVAHEQLDGTLPETVSAWAFTAPHGFSVYPGYSINPGCSDLDCPDPDQFHDAYRTMSGVEERLLGIDFTTQILDYNMDGIIDAGDLVARPQF